MMMMIIIIAWFKHTLCHSCSCSSYNNFLGTATGDVKTPKLVTGRVIRIQYSCSKCKSGHEKYAMGDA